MVHRDWLPFHFILGTFFPKHVCRYGHWPFTKPNASLTWSCSAGLHSRLQVRPRVRLRVRLRRVPVVDDLCLQCSTVGRWMLPCKQRSAKVPPPPPPPPKRSVVGERSACPRRGLWKRCVRWRYVCVLHVDLYRLCCNFQCRSHPTIQITYVSMFQCFNVSMFQCFNVSMFDRCTNNPRRTVPWTKRWSICCRRRCSGKGPRWGSSCLRGVQATVHLYYMCTCTTHTYIVHVHIVCMCTWTCGTYILCMYVCTVHTHSSTWMNW